MEAGNGLVFSCLWWDTLCLLWYNYMRENPASCQYVCQTCSRHGLVNRFYRISKWGLVRIRSRDHWLEHRDKHQKENSVMNNSIDSAVDRLYLYAPWVFGYCDHRALWTCSFCLALLMRTDNDHISLHVKGRGCPYLKWSHGQRIWQRPLTAFNL